MLHDVDLRVRNIILFYQLREQCWGEVCSLRDAAVKFNLIGRLAICTSPLGEEVDEGRDPFHSALVKSQGNNFLN